MGLVIFLLLPVFFGIVGTEIHLLGLMAEGNAVFYNFRCAAGCSVLPKDGQSSIIKVHVIYVGEVLSEKKNIFFSP